MTLLVGEEVGICWVTAVISCEEVIWFSYRRQEKDHPDCCGKHCRLIHVWGDYWQLALACTHWHVIVILWLPGYECLMKPYVWYLIYCWLTILPWLYEKSNCTHVIMFYLLDKSDIHETTSQHRQIWIDMKLMQKRSTNLPYCRLRSFLCLSCLEGLSLSLCLFLLPW